jgi:hypothetical protein
LLGGSTGVEGVVALLEATDDTFPVLDRLWSSYLNLASTRSTCSRIPRIPGSIRPYGGSSTATSARPPSGWKSASWGARMSTLPWGSSITAGRQTN